MFPFEAITERYSTDRKEEGKLFIAELRARSAPAEHHG